MLFLFLSGCYDLTELSAEQRDNLPLEENAKPEGSFSKISDYDYEFSVKPGVKFEYSLAVPAGSKFEGLSISNLEINATVSIVVGENIIPVPKV